MLRTRSRVVIGAVVIPAALLAALLLAFSGSTRTDQDATAAPFAKAAAGDPDAAADSPGEGPIGGWDAYLAAARAYPADAIPPAIAEKAKATFAKIARADKVKGDPKGKGAAWEQVGPQVNATEPGVLAFSGATNNTASRTTALVVSPDCGAQGCRVWAGVSGGGVWRTENALAANPLWVQLGPNDLAQNSVGTLTLDPTDSTHKTLYLGTGEPNRCSSGCEAGVGVYMSKDAGDSWKKLDSACVSNAVYSCVNPGQDAFLGRGIRAVVIDPNNDKHIFVGSAQAVRGLSHVIGNGGTTRLEPGANAPGLYESTDGGKSFTEVWNGNDPNSFGINDVDLDPTNPNVVYASAFDQGLWRRDAGAGATAFSQVFAPQFAAGLGVDRTMVALTTKNGHTRIYLTEGTQNTGGGAGPNASNFWRTDHGDQSAATLLASQAAGATVPAPPGNPFPANYDGWQKLTSNSTASPYYATNDFCTGQCWYDENVYTPVGHPDTVYVIGSYNYGELPCNTKGLDDRR